MRNKGALVLMELLVMVLVFALASAWCLQAFLQADAISHRTQRLDEAVILAQNGAEQLKAEKGAPAVRQALAAEARSRGFDLRITPMDSGIPGLEQVQICIYDGDAPVYSLTTGWQEVVP